MTTRIKICGVNDPAIARAAADAGADAIGLVFVDGSPRVVSIDQARAVISALPAFVEPVALFVDAPVDQIRSVCATLGLRTVQLHGRETPPQAVSLHPLSVIKALAYNDLDAAAASLKPWRGVANLAGLLFDAPPESRALPGGSGRPWDWQSLAALRRSGALKDLAPIVLAGGLNRNNVGDAIRTVRPNAVDVSSGVETSPGIKDASVVKAFCTAVHAADADVSKGD